MTTEMKKGFALWFTGLPGSGKSSVAVRTAETLRQRNLPVQILDSDELRRVLTPQPSYSEHERNWFYGVLVFIGVLLIEHGVNVLFAATAHKRSYRDRAREQVERFAEIFVRCSPQICRRRDPKGLYAQAERGQIDRLPGIDLPYEPPRQPELVVDTEQHDLESCTSQVVSFLEIWAAVA